MRTYKELKVFGLVVYGDHLDLSEWFVYLRVVRHAMSNFQNTIDRIFEQVESQLSAKLLKAGFQLESQAVSDKTFGSRYTEWRNKEDKMAVRLVWEGKESWFLIEESPWGETAEPKAWADIVLVPFDKTNASDEYFTSIIKDLVIEVS